MAQNAITGLEPKILWERFYEITQVPRPSKKEGKILNHLTKLLKDLNIEFDQDKVGNMIAKVPATKGKENSPVIVIQGHVDMVCEKNKEKVFDFENDPIELVRSDGWIKANGTTLGSDNGIGVAAGLALITDPDAVHGPLELLMTVDEETGLTGANNLQPGFVKGKILLNLDSEEDGAFYVGCSGGVDTLGFLKLEFTKIPAGYTSYNLHVTGLKGGHSGLDILQGRGNAIKILGRALKSLDQFGFMINNLDGGSLRNAIPREAEALIFIKNENNTEAEKSLKKFSDEILAEYKTVDGGVKVELSKSEDSPDSALTNEIKDKIINTLLAIPHGVIAMSADIPGLVETSTNLATIKKEDSNLVIGTSQRSSITSAKIYIAESVASIFKLAGFKAERTDGYPGWKPNMQSNLLKISKEVFKDLFNKEPEIKAIHAGLECGIIESKNPGTDMISFGPTIMGAHSPDEKINIETVEKFYKLLKGILKKITN